MSQHDVRALRKVYEEWAKGNFRPGGDLLAPDADLVSVPERTQVRGPEGISAYMRDFLEQWDDFRIEALDFTEVNDSVLVTERQSGTGRLSGIEITTTFYAVWTFEQGRVVRVRWESDRATALGLLE